VKRVSPKGNQSVWERGDAAFLLVLGTGRPGIAADNAKPQRRRTRRVRWIVFGAGAAGKFVTLKTVKRCMPSGDFNGVVVAAFALQHQLFERACAAGRHRYFGDCCSAECIAARTWQQTGGRRQ